MRMIYLVGAVLAVMAGSVLLLRALRRFAWRAPQPPAQPSFDMVELQSMLDKGLISREEFERLQGLIMAERARADAGRKLTGFEVIPLAKSHEAEKKQN
jgi:hypothetical protein